jgi:hypothetical protein
MHALQTKKKEDMMKDEWVIAEYSATSTFQRGVSGKWKIDGRSP